MSKQNLSVRIDKEDLELAAKLEIDLPALVRIALRQEIAKRAKRCPTCGRAMPKLNKS